MKAGELAKRLKRAGRWLLLVPACWIVLVFCPQAFWMLRSGNGILWVRGPGFAETFVLAAPGMLFWIAGWVVEGFAKDR